MEIPAPKVSEKDFFFLMVTLLLLSGTDTLPGKALRAFAYILWK